VLLQAKLDTDAAADAGDPGVRAVPAAVPHRLRIQVTVDTTHGNLPWLPHMATWLGYHTWQSALDILHGNAVKFG